MNNGDPVQPLSLPELDQWANMLRTKVRKFVKNKELNTVDD